MNPRNENFYLPAGLPAPMPDPDGLAAPYWNGLREERLMVQRCGQCGQWQFGPEWLCHRCHAFDPGWVEVEPRGIVYSWERVWHPVHPALSQRGAYLVVLVELPQAGGVRMVGNLLGPPSRDPKIGAPVVGVFEHHASAEPAFSLLHWSVVKGA